MKRTDNLESPFFQNLNLPDYFLWGYLKDQVYEDNSPTIEILQKNIKREIRRIPADFLERVIDNFNINAAGVIQQREAWIKHFHQLLGIREKKLEICKCFYVLKLLVVPLEKIMQKNFICCGKYDQLKLHSFFCGPPCI